jgi:hypothetical protein
VFNSLEHHLLFFRQCPDQLAAKLSDFFLSALGQNRSCMTLNVYLFL